MQFNYKLVLKTISFTMLLEGIAMIPSLISAAYFKENYAASALFFIAIFCIGVGLAFIKFLDKYSLKMRTREGLLIAILSWFFICFLGSLPYLFSNEGYSFIDCLFESIAGWTTTGAWVIPSSLMPKSLMLWKATTNWLGGMGVLVFTISIFPTLGIGGQNIIASELTGPQINKMSSRISDTAKNAYKIYISITLLELCFLLPTGMGKFDALVNTLSTISTSGIFDTGSEIILTFSPYVKVVITIFSILASMNFYVFFLIYMGNLRLALKNVEIRGYVLIILSTTAIIGIVLWFNGYYDSFILALGDSFVQVVAYSSTSGFSVANISSWPSVAQFLLMILILIGGCSASTAGSLKVIRVLICFKLITRGIYKRIHPSAIKPVMLSDSVISSETASSVTVYIMLYISVFILGSMALAWDNLDLTTTISASLSCISNNGAGVSRIADGNYSIFSTFGKSISALLMLIGRLEIYAVIVIFSKKFWYPDLSR